MDGDTFEYDEQYDNDEDLGDAAFEGTLSDDIPAWRRIDELREQRELAALLKEFYDD